MNVMARPPQGQKRRGVCCISILQSSWIGRDVIICKNSPIEDRDYTFVLSMSTTPYFVFAVRRVVQYSSYITHGIGSLETDKWPIVDRTNFLLCHTGLSKTLIIRLRCILHMLGRIWTVVRYSKGKFENNNNKPLETYLWLIYFVASFSCLVTVQ